MFLGYLASIVVSMMCIAAIDYRYKLAFFYDVRRTCVAVGSSLGALLVWDAAGIALDIFRIGDSPFMTGVVLAPHMPLEEPVLLLFLSYLSLVMYRGVERICGRI